MFVYEQQAEPEPEPIRAAEPKQTTPKKLLEKLEAPAREPTIRLTVDLTQSVHKKVSIFVARTPSRNRPNSSRPSTC
jgi:hypothetical protein